MNKKLLYILFIFSLHIQCVNSQVDKKINFLSQVDTDYQYNELSFCLNDFFTKEWVHDKYYKFDSIDNSNINIFMSSNDIDYVISNDLNYIYLYSYDSLIKIDAQTKKVIKGIDLNFNNLYFDISKSLNNEIGLLTLTKLEKDTLYGTFSVLNDNLELTVNKDIKIYIGNFGFTYEYLFSIKSFSIKGNKMYFTVSNAVASTIEFSNGVCISTGDKTSILYDYKSNKRYTERHTNDSLIFLELDDTDDYITKKRYAFKSSIHSINNQYSTTYIVGNLFYVFYDAGGFAEESHQLFVDIININTNELIKGMVNDVNYGNLQEITNDGIAIFQKDTICCCFFSRRIELLNE